MFSRFLERLKNEPAVVIGSLAAVLVAAASTAAGENLIGQNIADFLTKAFNPDSGWAIPLVVGLITRFFVIPTRKLP